MTAVLFRAAGIPRLLGVAVGLVGLSVLAFGLIAWHAAPVFPADTLTYYLAAVRLNTGGQLYDLRPTDVWLYEEPQFPLFGPPLIAVPWRVLETVAGPWSMIIWLIAMTYVGLSAVLYLTLATRGWAGAGLVLLAVPFMLLLGVGNVDSVVLAGIVLAWHVRDRPVVLGLVLGSLVSLKLTPAVFLAWALLTARFRAVAWAAGTVAGLAVLAAAATDPEIWPRYVRVMIEGGAGGQPLALVVVAVGFAVMALVRRQPPLAFAIALALIPLGSPRAAGHTWAILLAAFLPLTELIRDRAPSPGPAATERSAAYA